MNTNIEIIAKKLNLQDKEAKVFTSVGVSGSLTATQVASLTLINRATVYHFLTLLTQKGLLYREQVNGIYVYTLCNEESLSGYVDKQIYELEEAKDTLSMLVRKLPKRSLAKETSVQMFQGEEGVKLAFEMAFQAKKKEWDVIAPKKNYLSEVDEPFMARYLKKRKKIVTRTLWESSFGVATKEIVKERNIRYLSKEYQAVFTSLIIIFDSSALFVSAYKEQTASLVTSESIVSTLRVLFDMAWRSGEVKYT